MAQRTIPTGTQLPAARTIINDNANDSEQRLQRIEAVSYILSGNGAPSNANGNINDYYIDNSSQEIYQKNNTSWVFIARMKGDKGLTPMGNWDNTLAYTLDQTVFHRGSYWRARRANIGVIPSDTNAPDWELMAAGRFNAGVWATNTQYRNRDVVRYQGSEYLVTVDHVSTATTPNSSTNYALLASKGDQGIQGFKGDKGDQGIPGVIQQLQEEGTNVTQRSIVNFVGGIVSVVDDATAGAEKTRVVIKDREAWHVIGAAGEPGFQNSWVNHDLGFNTAAFYIDPWGRVFLRGLVKNATALSSTIAVIFTLPVGYRPAGEELMATISNSAIARVDVTTGGAVEAVLGASNWFSLDNVSFRAA